MAIFRRPSSGIAAGDAIPFRGASTTHLFFLSSPPGTTDYPERVRTTWRHVSSDDLVRWQELPPALEPGAPGEVDADGVWTGSVVERDGLYYLFYTGHRIGARNPQTICGATSRDLIHFTKRESNPVLLPSDACEPVDWRDPYVFYNEDEGRYWMIIAARLASGPRWRRGCLMLATSDDLERWEVEAEPLYVPGTTYCPECPELWPLDGRWYLVFSRFSEQAGTIYRVAEHPRGPFRVPTNDELGGRRWYASKSAPGADGRSRLFFGWVHDRAADGRWYWGGDFAAPREVTPLADGNLAARLPASVGGAYREVVSVDGAERTVVRLDAIGSFDHHAFAPAKLPGTYLARCAVSFDEWPAAFGLSMQTDVELGGWFFTFDRVRGTVHLSRSPQPLDDFWADLVGRGGENREVDGPLVAEARLPIASGPGGVECSLLVEGAIVELYVNDRVVLTHRIAVAGEQALGAFVVDGSATFELHVCGVASSRG